jgi:uncharacterized protein YndB with AHSA1/START domain
MTAKTHSGKARVSLPGPTQILIEREFDAPPELVFRAYTTPELVKRWWGGKRGTVTSAEIDLREGGRWRFVMIANDGQEVAFHGTYREIVEGERLVSTEVYEMPGAVGPDDDEPATLNTATFARDGERTKLSVLVECPDQSVRDAIIDSGMEGGMQESMDALEEAAGSLR